MNPQLRQDMTPHVPSIIGSATKIASGSFGTVYDIGDNLVLKVFNFKGKKNNKNGTVSRNVFKTEIDMGKLKGLANWGVPVMEYGSNSDLGWYTMPNLYHPGSTTLTLTDYIQQFGRVKPVLPLLKKRLLAMYTQSGIAHGDLHGNNIMVRFKGRTNPTIQDVRIIDLGTAKVLPTPALTNSNPSLASSLRRANKLFKAYPSTSKMSVWPVGSGIDTKWVDGTQGMRSNRAMLKRLNYSTSGTGLKAGNVSLYNHLTRSAPKSKSPVPQKRRRLSPAKSVPKPRKPPSPSPVKSVPKPRKSPSPSPVYSATTPVFKKRSAQTWAQWARNAFYTKIGA